MKKLWWQRLPRTAENVDLIDLFWAIDLAMKRQMARRFSPRGTDAD